MLLEDFMVESTNETILAFCSTSFPIGCRVTGSFMKSLLRNRLSAYWPACYLLSLMFRGSGLM